MPAQRHLCIHSTRRRAGNSHARGTASTGGKEGERGRGEGRGAVVAGEQTREAEQASRSLLRQRKDGNRAQAGMAQMERETQSLEPQLINAVLRKQHGATRSPRHCRSVTAGETGHRERPPQTTAPGGKGDARKTQNTRTTRNPKHSPQNTRHAKGEGAGVRVHGARQPEEAKEWQERACDERALVLGGPGETELGTGTKGANVRGEGVPRQPP